MNDITGYEFLILKNQVKVCKSKVLSNIPIAIDNSGF